MDKIIVIGSSNVDLTARVRTLPRPGETIGGARLHQANGGKGANQAVAAARLGADVLFLTCLGNDANGEMLASQFASDGIDTSKIKFSATPTGTALIFVDDNAENCIAVAPGSNNDLLPEDVDAIKDRMADSAYLLVQLEIPMPTVEHSILLADSLGVKVIVNPAPMNALREDIFSHIWLLTPNETEAEALTGVVIGSEEDARTAAARLMEKGVENVIITLGSKGSLVCTPEASTFVPARKVQALDTTGAGDAYNGALVAALSEGRSLVEAAKIATIASSIAVTRMGAQTSAPYRKEIDIINTL
ncbi:MAG: ribokinase [Bacteroidales bacterium]|nr:ribokinase [Bacteroidales bacterium]